MGQHRGRIDFSLMDAGERQARDVLDALATAAAALGATIESADIRPSADDQLPSADDQLA